MEQLNKVELRGIVGTIRIQRVRGSKIARISIVTDYLYQNREGEQVCETTWHFVTIWQKDSLIALEEIKKGDGVYIQGRIRNTIFRDSNGEERAMPEIIANKIEKLN